MNVLELSLEVHRDEGDLDDGFDTLFVAAAVDGELLTHPHAPVFDLFAFQDSMESSGEFYLLTCTCGAPVCAGIVRGVTVRHESGLIHWEFVEPQFKRHFVFEREVCHRAFQRLVDQGNRLISEVLAYSDRSVEFAVWGHETFFEAAKNMGRLGGPSPVL